VTRQWNAPYHVTNGSTARNGVFYAVRAEAVSGESKRKPVSTVLSLQLAIGRQTRRRSPQTVAPDEGVGGGGAPIVGSRCVGTPSYTQISEDRSRGTRKLRHLRRWECYQATTSEDAAG
jgi:hypothetical protein